MPISPHLENGVMNIVSRFETEFDHKFRQGDMDHERASGVDVYCIVVSGRLSLEVKELIEQNYLYYGWQSASLTEGTAPNTVQLILITPVPSS